MSRRFAGPGWSEFESPRYATMGASEFYGRMESSYHVPLRSVSRGRVILAQNLTLVKPGGGSRYNASELAARVALFNSDIEGNYLTDPMQFSDIDVDNYGLAKLNTAQDHHIWVRTGSDIEQSLAVRFRPMASYFWIYDHDQYALQAVKLASNAQNYIVVRMQFDYTQDLGVFPDDGSVKNWRNFTLAGSGPAGRDGVIQLDPPSPIVPDELDDPLPTGIGWAHVPFFGMTWAEFQARYV